MSRIESYSRRSGSDCSRRDSYCSRKDSYSGRKHSDSGWSGAGAEVTAIGAEASVNLLVWGKCKCSPDGQPLQYDNTIWGGPAYSGGGVGFMYTAYSTWDAFFNNVTSCHAQGIASGPGILQITWFNASGTPVGQFNGAVGGVGVFEAGGEGKWQKK